MPRASIIQPDQSDTFVSADLDDLLRILVKILEP